MTRFKAARMTSERGWQVDAAAAVKEDADWCYAGALLAPDGTWSIADYVNARTGLTHTVRLTRAVFRTSELRSLEIRRQLARAS